jgi:hypothetical protein
MKVFLGVVVRKVFRMGAGLDAGKTSAASPPGHADKAERER